MGLLRLAEEIQEHILAMPRTLRRPVITERALRRIVHIAEPGTQVEEFKAPLGAADRTRNLR
jgi:hypothetical protein